MNHDRMVEETKRQVLDMLKKTIRPEFLNRIDDIIMFEPLDQKQIKQIVTLQIDKVRDMLANNGINLKMSDEAINFLARVGYDPEFGARPVKRAIQHYLLNDLSKKILSGNVNREVPISVDAVGDVLVFNN
jgi:ATP-dependent Clp protease ATP-binding subunit ClpB